MRQAWLLCAFLISCMHEKLDEQSFSDALQLMCNAPSTADAAYWKTHLQNTEAITLFEALANQTPAGRQAKITDAIAKAHLESCPRFADAATFEHVPVVAAAPGALELEPKPLVVTATKAAVVIDGKNIIALANGAPYPKDREGMNLPKVQSYLANLGTQATKNGAALPRLDLAIDPELSYGIVMKLISSAKKSGWHQFGVVMMVAGKPMLVPIDLPIGSSSASPTQKIST